ncbi:hypothetical protein HanIR_Chr16g0830311 [Helianthus annuus]|nr:hypothetical protein HanIR_Chr16g0830311 [Helianthus annuus]
MAVIILHFSILLAPKSEINNIIQLINPVTQRKSSLYLVSLIRMSRACSILQLYEVSKYI